MMKDLKQKDFLWLVPIIILVFGFLPLPYGYYTLSRIIVCFCAAILAYKLKLEKNVLISWVFIFLVILYNPIIPIHFYNKNIWILINIPTILMFYKNRNNI